MNVNVSKAFIIDPKYYDKNLNNQYKNLNFN